MSFHDRKDAGEQLARALHKFRQDSPVVVALPRGGVPVGVEVAHALDAPLELLIVRKIGVPRQPELAMGAVVDGEQPITFRNEDIMAMAGVSDAEFVAIRDRELAEIDRRRRRYLADRPQPSLQDRTILVVDDGIATGATIRVALRALRMKHPRRLVVAVPVAAADTVEILRGEADEVICLEAPENLGAIGRYYADFGQVEDEEVLQAMASTASAKPDKGPAV